ncbi:MAG: rod shape-determining protein MreC [Alphaproteobacteria bacterium]|nr:MAG: rod shape-determining protein MreC [Alphaproteobacteria bacterium]
MAPPSNRRPGFSRRAQYGLFLGYVVALGGVLFAAMLLVVAIIDPTGFNALKGAALDATSPISAGGRSVVRFFSDIGGSVSNYFDAASQNGELKKKLAENEKKLLQAKATDFENARLRRMLFDSAHRFAILSAGSGSGVRPGQPVRSAEGLIGRVLETGRFASRILMVTDGASNVPVRMLRDGTPAIATGRGDGYIDLKTLEVGKNPFRRGDILVTSGTGGIYPPGIPVAVVISVQRDSTLARPTADPARIDFALVQAIYQPAATAQPDETPGQSATPIDSPPPATAP